MCGIAGIIQFGTPNQQVADVRTKTRDSVSRMCLLQAHRGPDMEGIWQSDDGKCTLGHRRLSIIDLSDAGQQPMTDRSGRYHITFNGEIYNYRVLKLDLEVEGAQFRTSTDTEVLLEGFALHGSRILEKVDGMFAAAIYDTQTGETTLFRDRVGEKPLYYQCNERQLIFGSELHAVASVNDEPTNINPLALGLYLTLRYVPPPHTMIEGINKLEPGQVLVFDAKGLPVLKRYFSFEPEPIYTYSQDDFEAKSKALERLLITSISKRLESDVPLGLFLSSGIDSSLVCALTKKKLGITPKTFSIGFEGDESSEHFIAEQIARHLGTEHQTFMLSPTELHRLGSDIGAMMDEPNGDRSCLPTLLLSREVRRHVTVALSGDGADELFGGYGRYSLPIGPNPAHTHPESALKDYFNRALPVFGIDRVDALCDGVADVSGELLGQFRGVFIHTERAALHFWRMLDFYSYLPGAVLAKVDRMSMRHGLEVRTPFLEPQVMAMAETMPQAYLEQGEERKIILRQILSQYLPRDITSLPKRGFGMPQSVFMNNAEMIHQMLGEAMESLRGTRFFSEYAGLLQSIAQAAPSNINSAWAMIVLGQWVRSFPKRL
ncbi:MAG: asparagine synthase (glutamine-hydrolyzing) [Luminiphilus sp.]